MGEFAELYACSSLHTANFFFGHLHEMVPDPKLTPEKTYGATILGHFAQVSRKEEGSPVFTNLSEVYDKYVHIDKEVTDADVLEKAGADTLLLAGFFQDQMRRRHNIRWYYQHGHTFYGRAGDLTPFQAKRALLLKMSNNFTFWADVFCRLNREMRDSPYLLRLN